MGRLLHDAAQLTSKKFKKAGRGIFALVLSQKVM